MRILRDLDAGAFVTAHSRILPRVEADFDAQAKFVFPVDPKIDETLAAFALEPALIDAHRLLAARRQLYAAIRDLKRGGGQ